MSLDAFEHVNLNEVDDSIKPVEEREYTLEINRMNPSRVKIKKADSPYVGQEVLVLKAKFTIVDDERYSGRPLFDDFWTTSPLTPKFLKRIKSVTGVEQDGDSLEDFGAKFATLDPPARFKVTIAQTKDFKNPEALINQIKYFTAKPA